MFFKGSRYKDLSEISVTDSDKQRIRSKTLRWIPETRGTFQHTVNQTDRLDLLSYKYYGDPKKWWLICDANPDFALPTDLLNRNPIMQEIFILEITEDDNKWSLLIKDLQNLRSMRDIQADIPQSSIEVTYNRKELNRQDITNVITSQGFAVKSISKKERTGQKIIIPPNQVL